MLTIDGKTTVWRLTAMNAIRSGQPVLVGVDGSHGLPTAGGFGWLARPRSWQRTSARTP